MDAAWDAHCPGAWGKSIDFTRWWCLSSHLIGLSKLAVIAIKAWEQRLRSVLGELLQGPC